MRHLLCEGFTIGQRVVLARVAGPVPGGRRDYRGLTGTVKKIIKCRDAVDVIPDNPPEGHRPGGVFEAYARNVDAI